MPSVTDIGYTVMVDAHGDPYWVPSAHLAEPPPLHLRVHSCPVWRTKRMDRIIDALHVSTDDMTP